MSVKLADESVAVIYKNQLGVITPAYVTRHISHVRKMTSKKMKNCTKNSFKKRRLPPACVNVSKNQPASHIDHNAPGINKSPRI